MQLESRIIQTTLAQNIYNVVFETHAIARRAFCKQREIGIRMVPPKNSRRNWLRNPCPRFHVKYETKSRLIIRKGKSVRHEVVGSFLMSSSKNQKGCFLWADQLKGNRIRIVGYEGKFMFPNGKIVAMKVTPSDGPETKSIGWVSYRNRQTKEDFVIRRSGILLREYIHDES